MTNPSFKFELARRAAVLGLLCALASAQAQPAPPKADLLSHYDRQMLVDMMQTVQHTLVKNYYDPTFHGVDIKARYNIYLKRLEAASNFGAAFRQIAAYLDGLNDSHTYFIPPERSWSVFYGFTTLMVGSRAFIADVRPGSDAAAKLHPGDEILSLDGYRVDRNDFAALNYDLYALQPRPQLSLVLRDPSGAERLATVKSKVVQHVRLNRDVQVELGEWDRLGRPRDALADGVFIWKMPDFDESPDQIDSMMDQGKRHRAVVLDLRGNPGGSIAELQYLLGDFLPQETKIADLAGRKHRSPLMAKPHGHPYAGSLIVLTDSGSASAAELFARVVQLNHRGIVVGDRTAGAVMEAQMYPLEVGVGIASLYGLSVTVEDLIMTDGHSLEHAGVTPDVAVTPTPADLAAGRDPALARAVTLAGGTLTPEAAGKLFPFLWRDYRG